MTNRERIMVSVHALERYRLYYPDAIGRDVIDAIGASIPIDAETAWTLAISRGQVRDSHAYLLHHERTGIFVVEERFGKRWDVVVTFLRFYAPDQYRTAVRLWPGPAPLTATATWCDGVRAEDARAVAQRLVMPPAPSAPTPPASPGPRPGSALRTRERKERRQRQKVRGGGGQAQPVPDHPARANRASRVGGLACYLLDATRIRISDLDRFPGGLALLDQLAAQRAFERDSLGWRAIVPGGVIRLLSCAPKHPRRLLAEFEPDTKTNTEL